MRKALPRVTKCDGICEKCKFPDCILTDEEALQMEIEKPTYHSTEHKLLSTNKTGVDWRDREQKLAYKRMKEAERRAKHKDRVKAQFEACMQRKRERGEIK